MLLLSILWRKWSTEAIWFMVSADLWANIFRDREQQSEIEAEKTSEKSSHIYNIFPVRSKSSMDEVASLFVESLFSHIIFSCTKYPIFLCSFRKNSLEIPWNSNIFTPKSENPIKIAFAAHKIFEADRAFLISFKSQINLKKTLHWFQFEFFFRYQWNSSWMSHWI